MVCVGFTEATFRRRSRNTTMRQTKSILLKNICNQSAPSTPCTKKILKKTQSKEKTSTTYLVTSVGLIFMHHEKKSKKKKPVGALPAGRHFHASRARTWYATLAPPRIRLGLEWRCSAMMPPDRESMSHELMSHDLTHLRGERFISGSTRLWRGFRV